MIDLAPGTLLRGHVTDRTQRHPGLGQLLVALGFGQPKIENAHPPGPVHKNIERLDVSMDRPEGVGRSETIANLHDNIEAIVQREFPLVHQLPKRGAVNILHGHEYPFVDFTDLVNRHYIGMTQRRRGSGLPGKSISKRTVGRKVIRQKLQCHLPTQIPVAGQVNITHPPGTKFVRYFVMGYHRPRLHEEDGPGSIIRLVLSRHLSFQSGKFCLFTLWRMLSLTPSGKKSFYFLTLSARIWII